ncbi:MAG: type II secretion system protein [Candidatus Omnitrophica bacterium]|nr:type II secretion system protein [Candidatus Omnitrophota bacterium]
MNKSFTFLEMTIVLVIIGVVTAFGTVGYRKTREKALVKQACVNLRLIKSAQRTRKMEEAAGGYEDCSGFVICNSDLGLNLADDGWTYSCNGGLQSCSAVRNFGSGNCTYQLTDANNTITPGAGNAGNNCPIPSQ